MRLLRLILLLCLFAVHGWAVNLDVRHFYITNDVASSRPVVAPLRWYQGESVLMDFWAVRGAEPVDLSGAGLFARLETFLTTNLNLAYMSETGSIASATNGYITFDLAPGRCNLPTNTYETHIRLYQPVGGTNRYVGTVYRSAAQVLWSLSAEGVVYQGPYTNATEYDPVFRASAAYGIAASDTNEWHNIAGSVGDIMAVTVSGGILAGGTNTGSANIALTTNALTNALSGLYALPGGNWTSTVAGMAAVTLTNKTTQGGTAYGWGDHGAVGYLTNEPVFLASAAGSITSGQTGQWGQAYGWGDHAGAGYLTNEPVFLASVAATITEAHTTKWSMVYDWGDWRANPSGYVYRTDYDAGTNAAIDDATNRVAAVGYLKRDGSVTITGVLRPDAANSRNLGTPSAYFQTGYFANVRSEGDIFVKGFIVALAANTLDIGSTNKPFQYLFLGSTPTASVHAATKGYVDAGTNVLGQAITNEAAIRAAADALLQGYTNEAHTAYGWGDHGTAGYATEGYVDAATNTLAARIGAEETARLAGDTNLQAQVEAATDTISGHTNQTIAAGAHGGFARSVEAKTNHFNVAESNLVYGTAYAISSGTIVTASMPSVSSTNVGGWVSFAKLGTGTVAIDAADADVIADSGPGCTIYCDQTNETYTTITLMLATETQWVITGAHGTWVTTE